ncbi:hypothetical protein MM440_12430 [Arsenicicoccus piscis]|uniref:Abi-like protein n=1 Tax=Arsenicicoccus piscis TaxID=673954 RepID=A0ABQ6HQB4_9MICO|nr:hypothetical protein [Arsenicicoccus piscis]MCH8628544.1 hypothetical protein [Arsenicicoccus piscis]GMA19874.1 hypothetical protein GCM10025862_18950 [Arsenicicoccus piscis]
MPDQPDEAVDYERLEWLLTEERLGSYFRAANGEREPAFALYEWNIEASAAAVSLSAMVEVVLRNALDREMAVLGEAKGWSDWLDDAPLDHRARKDVRQARERASRGRRSATRGHVVAELNLGFWRFLMSKRYLTSLWIPALVKAFPGAEGDARTTQRLLEGHVEQINFLRNRAAHHEPIHRRDLLSDLDRAMYVAGCIYPVAGRWIRSRETLSSTVAQRPETQSRTEGA